MNMNGRIKDCSVRLLEPRSTELRRIGVGYDVVRARGRWAAAGAKWLVSTEAIDVSLADLSSTLSGLTRDWHARFGTTPLASVALLGDSPPDPFLLCVRPASNEEWLLRIDVHYFGVAGSIVPRASGEPSPAWQVVDRATDEVVVELAASVEGTVLASHLGSGRSLRAIVVAREQSGTAIPEEVVRPPRGDALPIHVFVVSEPERSRRGES